MKNLTSNKPDVVKSETIKEEVKLMGVENNIEINEQDGGSGTKEKPVLQKKKSIEKPLLQKKSSKEKLVSEVSVDVNDDVENNKMEEYELTAEKVETVSLKEQMDRTPVNHTENEEVDSNRQEEDKKEKEVKDESTKMKRPSSAHHGHRRHSSASELLSHIIF